MGSLGKEPFATTFAVPMHCDSCVQDISQAIRTLDGIQNIEANLQDQLVFIEGTVAPSAIVSAIESTGREAILRGSGTSNSAGVCILETHAAVADPVRGLVRMVQIGSNTTLVDLSIRGLPAGTYQATVRECGDISHGATSTGGIWEAVKKIGGLGSSAEPQPRGIFGNIEVSQDGKGSIFLDRPFAVWEVIGRSMVVSKQQTEGLCVKDDPDTLVGVIARSAGVWENDKTVCACSGKTVWEERKEQTERGML